MGENARAVGFRTERPATHSGREWLEALVTGDVAGPGPLATMGIRLIAVGDGTATMRMDPGDRHDNGLGMVHGGIVCTMIDAAAGCAVLSLLPPGRFGPSQDIRVTFVRPVVPGGGPVIAEGRVLNLSRRTALAEASISDAAGRLLAHGTLTCAVVDPRAPRDGGSER